MAFQQKEWKNRLSEHPTRRTLTKLGEDADTMLVEVAREEGTIMQQGDPFSAANMNDLEQRIAAGIGGGDENMAPIEEGPESENAYAVGQLLIYEGQLYRVISAIAVGNTLVDDVNIEATTISNEFVGELTANGNRLYMDYKNGKYGVNTSPTRGADTFIPFSENDKIYAAIVARGVTPASDSTEDLIAAIALIDKTHWVSVSWQFIGGDHPDNYRYTYSVSVDGQTRASGQGQGWSGSI